MKKLLSLFTLVLIFSCGGKGVEGFVGQIISITAEENLDETDIDYTWIIINQPDGSLIGPKDLKYNNNGQEMVFIPDYPGDYTFEVSLTKSDTAPAYSGEKFSLYGRRIDIFII